MCEAFCLNKSLAFLCLKEPPSQIMRRITSAIFDSVLIRDLSLVLKRSQIVEIPDEIFNASPDLKRAIIKNEVICDGMAHHGQIAKLTCPSDVTIQPKQQKSVETFDDVQIRLRALEKAVSTILSNNYQQTSPKYDDYLLYTHTFSMSNYDAMVFDAFTDKSKRDNIDPGNAELRYGKLVNTNNEDRFYFKSKEFYIEEEVTEIFPMAKWSGDGAVKLYIKTGKSDIEVLNTGKEPINQLWTPIKIDKTKCISILVTLESKYNYLEFSSYSILLKF